jgi:hypothetical protein
MIIICPKCGYRYDNHTNFFGKVCMNCSYFIKPERQVFSNLRSKYDDNKNDIIDYLRNKLKDKK